MAKLSARGRYQTAEVSRELSADGPAHELNGMCVSCARIDTKLVSGLDRPLTPFKVDLNGTPIDKGEDYGW